MRRPFEDEYPMRPLDTSAAEAAAPTLQYTNEDYNTLASKLYTQTNTILPVPVQPRPKYAGTDISVASPTDLFKDSIRLESKHGPFVEQLLRKSNCTHVILNAHQFWDFLVEWFSLMSKRLKNALRRRNVGKQPRHMHSQGQASGVRHLARAYIQNGSGMLLMRMHRLKLSTRPAKIKPCTRTHQSALAS